MKRNSVRIRLIIFTIGLVFLWFLRRYPRHGRQISCTASGDIEKESSKSRGKRKVRIVSRAVDLFVQKVKEEGLINDLADIKLLFPKHYEVLGHVVLIKLNPGVTRDVFSCCARSFAESLFPRAIDVVLLDIDGIHGELRRPQLEILWANDPILVKMPKESLRYTLKMMKNLPYTSADTMKLFESITDSFTFTTHVEKGVRYSFDVCNVMFCSGNGTERMHFSSILANNEVVVDMFAGIGYFSLPLAMYSSVKVIHAIEKNPTSMSYLRYNIYQNKVSHIIHTHFGDNREIASELCGQCDRVIMGYIPSCETFLPRAISFLKQSSSGRPIGTLHYHFLSDQGGAMDKVQQHVDKALGTDICALMRIKELRSVKSYAPKRLHYVADLVFEGK